MNTSRTTFAKGIAADLCSAFSHVYADGFCSERLFVRALPPVMSRSACVVFARLLFTASLSTSENPNMSESVSVRAPSAGAIASPTAPSMKSLPPPITSPTPHSGPPLTSVTSAMAARGPAMSERTTARTSAARPIRPMRRPRAAGSSRSKRSGDLGSGVEVENM